MTSLDSLELCAGAGGQAFGLEKAGFDHQALVEIDNHCCQTLRLNRPHWNVIEGDLTYFSGKPFKGVDLVAGGLPCPPFSVAGKQLGEKDERNMFSQGLRIVDEVRPKSVLFENVKGFLDPSFSEYRETILNCLKKLNYHAEIKLIHCSEFGVCQLRPRVLVVAIQKKYTENFRWPEPYKNDHMTVGKHLYDLMSENGWRKAKEWRLRANTIAPTIVGGSKKHGGPDLGPTRAKKAWLELAVDGKGIANTAPERDFEGIPRLTNKMVARLQGFEDTWLFSGGKTAAYRQIGNAFPPLAAEAVAKNINKAITIPKSIKISRSDLSWLKQEQNWAQETA